MASGRLADDLVPLLLSAKVSCTHACVHKQCECNNVIEKDKHDQRTRPFELEEREVAHHPAKGCSLTERVDSLRKPRRARPSGVLQPVQRHPWLWAESGHKSSRIVLGERCSKAFYSEHDGFHQSSATPAASIHTLLASMRAYRSHAFGKKMR